jgi:chitodextrinase
VYRNGVLVGSPGGTSFTDTGLNVSSNYTYTISAFDNTANQSAQSAPFSASSSNDTTPPTIPTGLHTTSVLDTSIDLSWTASTDDVGVTGYKIYRNSVLIGTTNNTNFSDTGLQPVTNYSYAVVAYDAANNVSAPSAPLNTQTAFDTTAPSTPGGVQTTVQTDTSVSLSWTAATDNVAVSGYNVYRGNTLVTSTVGTSYTDSGLGVNSSYTYRIQAYDGSGNNSAQSAPLNASTLPDTTPPATPANLADTGDTTTSIGLSWNAATDDVAVTGYRVYRNGALLTSVAGTTYTNMGLHYNTIYHYSVTALDAAGNESAASSTLNASTLPDTTPPTVNMTAPANGQGVQLTFPVSATASDDLALSKVEFFADTTLIGTVTSPPFAMNWNSYAVHNGAHSLTAEAFDASGNNTSQSVTVTITNPPPPLSGDLNGDHRVNLVDLSILLSRWGKAGTGDLNGNGRVDIFDLSTLLSHYGQDDSNYH